MNVTTLLYGNLCVFLRLLLYKNIKKELLMKHIFLIIFFGLLIQLNAMKSNSNNNIKEDAMTTIFELAINQAKTEEYENFLETRKKFVEILSKEEAALNEGKWKPFFTVATDMNLEEILIGMTEWNSMQGFGESASRLLPSEVTKNYFNSFNPLAYVLLETIDGNSFDMSSIKQDGSVVEFAIRKGKSTDSFGDKREAFFNYLTNYDGYKFAREFKVYELDVNGMPKLTENTQAVVIVWENIEKFQSAANPIFGSKEYQEFANLIEVKTYFASFPIK